MKKYRLTKVILYFFIVVWSVGTAAQSPDPAPSLNQPTLDSDGNITVTGNLVLSTPDLSEGSFVYYDSIKLRTNQITKYDADLSGGIKGSINHPDGFIKLEVFLIDNSFNKSLIYKVDLTESSSNSYSTGTIEALTRTSDSGHVYHHRSNDIKSLMQYGEAYSIDKERIRRNWFKRHWRTIAVAAVVGTAAAIAGTVTIASGGTLSPLGVAVISAGFAVAAGVSEEINEATEVHYSYPTAPAKPVVVAAGPNKAAVPDFDEMTDQTRVFPAEQPAIVKLTIDNATFMGAKVPGIGEIKPFDFFLRLKLSVNGSLVHSSVIAQNALDGFVDTTPLNIDLGNLTMGDEVTFEIGSPFFSSPFTQGAADVWIARFAGDLMYYCTPSATPGAHKPFLGYDTRVHNLMLRRYPQGYQKTYEPYRYDADKNTLTWSWTLARRMSADKTRYTHVHEWPKTQALSPNNPITLLDGTKSYKQRRNQKEGLNMQYLTYWTDWETSDFQKYTGAKYMLGFDDDELAIFNTKFPNPRDDLSKTLSNIHVLKLERLPWKETPEGPQTYNLDTGYPESGFVLNEMVTAYFKANRTLGPYPYLKKYDGYEIQDIGTSPEFPDGTRVGNNTAPGHIKIDIFKKPINIQLNVQAPLRDDKGFYGSIRGTRWPSYGEEYVPYILDGLQDIDMDILEGISMEYEYEDKLGILQQQTHYARDLSTESKRDIINQGYWRVRFDMEIPSYASVTAYYQRETNTQRVMIAGRELKPIFLLFTGVQTADNGREDLADNLNLKEERGIGSKIWLEDFRASSFDDYTVSRRFGNSVRYTKKYSKEYVFNVNDKVTFVTFDGDPHTFASDDPEWYLGSRSMAKRVTDEYLDGSYGTRESVPSAGLSYLDYYIKDLNSDIDLPVLQHTGRSGKEFTNTWDEAGVYEMKVDYRGTSDLYYKITVVDYGNDASTDEPILGRVIQRDLKEWEKEILGITNTNAKVAEVVDIYSRYAYVDGPRATVPKINRWANQRDFDSKFEWNYVIEDGDDEVEAEFISEYGTKFLLNYSYYSWFWFNWAHHYSSNWLRPLVNGEQGLPPGLRSEDVDRIYNEKTDLDDYDDYIQEKLFTPTPAANWQHTIPLVSMTENQGPRLRTNPSSAYDLEAVFDHDTGAFSGNPTLPPSTESIQAPNISDSDKNKLDLYYKLRNKQMIIFDDSEYSITQFEVYNTDANVPGGKTFIASGE